MTSKAFFFTFAFIALASSCDKPKSPSGSPSVPSPVIYPDEQPQTRECDVTQLTKPQVANGPVRHETVSVVRVLQRTIRRNCNFEIVSDKFETVGEPRIEMHFTPRRDVRGLRTQLLVANRQTCDTNSAELFPRRRSDHSVILNASRPRFDEELHIDRTQDNYLDYTFRVCDPRRDGRRCEPTYLFEQGTIRLTVVYSEQRREGIRELLLPRSCRSGR